MAFICPRCGTENPDDVLACIQCGASLSASLELFSGADNLAAGIPYSFCVELISGRITHPGRIRLINEDSLLVIECNRVNNSVGLPIGVYAVADGVGGQAAGEIASKVAVDTIAVRAHQEAIFPYLNSGAIPFTDPTAWMVDTTNAANRAIYRLGQEMKNNMGTTLVWALVLEDTAYIANVGDSRAYLCRADGFRQVTNDHSLVGEMISGGQLTSAQARTHRHRNVITRVMGYSPQVQVDVFVEPMALGQRLLLCSDGVSSMLDDDVLWKSAMSSDNLSKACANVAIAANEAGGKDNITAILVEMIAMQGDRN